MINSEMDDVAIGVGGVGNYYGGLSVCEYCGKFYWTIENWDGMHWEEIPKPLYDELIKVKFE